MVRRQKHSGAKERGERLRGRRLALGIETAKEMANLVGLSLSYVSSIETGRLAVPSVDMMAIITKAYGMSAAEYFKSLGYDIPSYDLSPLVSDSPPCGCTPQSILTETITYFGRAYLSHSKLADIRKTFQVKMSKVERLMDIITEDLNTKTQHKLQAVMEPWLLCLDSGTPATYDWNKTWCSGIDGRNFTVEELAHDLHKDVYLFFMKLPMVKTHDAELMATHAGTILCALAHVLALKKTRLASLLKHTTYIGER